MCFYPMEEAIRFTVPGPGQPTSTSPEPVLLSRRRSPGDDPAHPAVVPFRIPLVPRDDMEVEVHDRLPCVPPDVHPDIVPFRVVELIDPNPHFDDQVEEC